MIILNFEINYYSLILIILPDNGHQVIGVTFKTYLN